MIAWLKKLIGYRTTKAPSASLSFAETLAIASGIAVHYNLLGGNVEVTTVTNTNSMLPTLDANAVILLERCRFDELREGDIVTWWSKNPHRRILHRLNEKIKGGWWPLGDGNGRMDPELVTPANFDRRLCGILYARKDETTDN